MASLVNYNVVQYKRSISAAILLLLLAAILLPLANHRNPFGPDKQEKYSMILLKRDGYDAKTGKWINKKQSQFAFAISPEEYEKVKNWYATDSGTNNPNNLETQAPKEGYTYIFTPYNDPKHPNSVGMSSMGKEGYKGYWYADDLKKATDSLTQQGEDAPIAPPKDDSPAMIAFGGYDARTGNWVTTIPSEDAFSVNGLTYERIKNWFTTGYGANNPLNLPLQIPKENYTYLFVPFNDPKHPGIVGMSFQGGNAYRGYWYADKIGASKDTVSTNTPPTNVVTPPTDVQQQAPPPKQDN